MLKRPDCPVGLHNRIFGKEKCHTHRWKWRQWLHEKHCLKLKCPYAKKGYGKWGGKFDTRDEGLI
jgi:hypothetical protein